jgi:hypothetical protein
MRQRHLPSERRKTVTLVQPDSGLAPPYFLLFGSDRMIPGGVVGTVPAKDSLPCWLKEPDSEDEPEQDFDYDPSEKLGDFQ